MHLVQRHFAELEELEAEQGTSLPLFVRREFASLISCGSLGNGFVRLKCDSCSFERFVAFSCKSSTLCPSCAARRMFSFAERLTESVFPDQPLRQWVISPPSELVAILGARSEVMMRMVQLFSRAITRVYESKSRLGGLTEGQTGSVCFLPQCIRSAPASGREPLRGNAFLQLCGSTRTSTPSCSTEYSRKPETKPLCFIG